ncbi:hypothetical protein [Arthrobacter sp. UYCo732]|uniref:pullulanase X25 domain-containing protein n=1 Tax=Arthrobacter sp. UYCo732 TaxID=3156336 RepID=UPI003399ADB3
MTVAGSFNSELGCPADWDPACPTASLTLDPADNVWRLTAENLPPGQYEYKVALNGTWGVNYGADGALNGNNIVLDHPGGPATFRYDHRTRMITAG